MAITVFESCCFNPYHGCVLDEDQAPVADAGGEQIVMLPAPLVTINGSKSTDDRKIVSYSWTRDRSSPAAGVSDSLLVDIRKHFIIVYLSIVLTYLNPI